VVVSWELRRVLWEDEDFLIALGFEPVRTKDFQSVNLKSICQIALSQLNHFLSRQFLLEPYACDKIASLQTVMIETSA
jgi:hypothetical protein